MPTLSLFEDDKPAASAKITSKTSVKTAVQIWCDGACSGNPGPGGWGAILEENGERRELSGGQVKTTNNQMELLGLISALRAVAPGTRVEIVTDSEYVVKGATQWIRGWIRNGWKNAAKQPVKNQELWQQLWDLLGERPHKFQWVKGHAGHAENERCDELAREAIGALRSAKT